MEEVYSGLEFKKMINETISGYKPVYGKSASNTKKDTNDSYENLKDADVSGETNEIKVKPTNQSTDFGNNKNMLDLEFDGEPDDLFKKRVKKQVTGEDSEFGNKPTDAEPNKVNKTFYDAAQKAIKNVIDKREDLENSGLTGKFLPVDKKSSVFESNCIVEYPNGKPLKYTGTIDEAKEYIEAVDPNNKINLIIKTVNETKLKRLNFKNTTFLNDKHALSLIPKDFKVNENVFIMKDKEDNKYIVEWVFDVKNSISEGKIIDYYNKNKTDEDINKIKNLYEYKIGDENKKNLNNETNKILDSIKIVRQITDNE